MAGSNQAMNLTGMLSQIGGTLGSEIGGQDLMVRNIQNAGRPNVDPTDPVGMMKLADWQNKMGRTQEANVSVGMLSEKRLADAEAREKSKQAARDNYATEIAMYEQGRDRALAEGDDFEALSYDRKIQNLRPTTEATQKMQTAALNNGATAFEARETQGRQSAAQQYVLNEKRLAELKAMQANLQPGTDQYQNVERARGELRARQDDMLRQPGMAEEIKKAGDTAAGISANSAAAEQVQMEDMLSKVAAQTGLAGFENYLNANPAMKPYAEPYRKALKEHEDTLASLPPLVSEDSNTIYVNHLRNDVEALSDLSEAERQMWQDRISIAETNQAGPGVAREQLIGVGKDLATFKATQNKQDRSAKAFTISALKDIVPAALRQFRDEDPYASHWFGGTEIDDLADDLLDDEEKLNDLAARASAEGVSDIEGLRNWLLDYMGQSDEGFFTWLGADNAAEDYRQKKAEAEGVTTVQVNGQTVTIKEKK